MGVESSWGENYLARAGNFGEASEAIHFTCFLPVVARFGICLPNSLNEFGSGVSRLELTIHPRITRPFEPFGELGRHRVTFLEVAIFEIQLKSRSTIIDRISVG